MCLDRCFLDIIIQLQKYECRVICLPQEYGRIKISLRWLIDLTRFLLNLSVLLSNIQL